MNAFDPFPWEIAFFFQTLKGTGKLHIETE